MLTSTKRRILHILSVSMAIASVAYGLVLKYDGAPSVPNDLAQIDKQEIITDEPATVLKVNNPVTSPNN
ncbi:hypothetical protein [Roseivirga misakiensis]|uniref:Uncharacterized protein n=1 Tax=Roseivirga misakiensis TaxID=1563681 RepID=A0A1E5T4V2_9BACT|nr:hypothetical protein [Roseivirga misakiensis]OEK06390.1 hypothetical protein BFP71_01555 [Roseivirga misakiensis]